MRNSINKILLISFLLSSFTAFADDLDLLVKKVTDKKANILFILDTSQSMNEAIPNSSKTRMKVMQDALTNVLNAAPSDFNVGISNYGGEAVARSYSHYYFKEAHPNYPFRVPPANMPNGIHFPITPIDNLAIDIIQPSLKVNNVTKWEINNIPHPNATVTVRQYLSDITKAWIPNGNTPIVDSLYEAALYFRGNKMKWGYDKAALLPSSHPSTYTHPAPNQVDPLETVSNDPASCDHILNFVAENLEETDFTCPYDPSNPAAPGLSSNCAALASNCQSITEFVATAWMNYTECTITDENGNCTGTTQRTWDGTEDGVHVCNKWDNNGTCIGMVGGQSSSWDTIATDRTQCSYPVCTKSPAPAPNYISPITDECTSNNIILLSDGKPEYMQGTGSRPPSIAGTRSITEIIGNTACVTSPNGFTSGQCGPELTHYLATHDNAPSSNIPGDQFIDTFVIGFSTGITANAELYLKSLVTIKDDPNTANTEGYFSATSEAELAEAFKKAFQTIKLKNQNTYSTATYSVKTGISLTHGKYAYIPVFEQSNGSIWEGNLKKYEVIDDELYGYDATGVKARATDDNGAFIQTVNDLWRTSYVKNKVNTGGVANKINPATRQVFTDNGSTITSIANVTKAQLNVATTLEKDALVKFIRGKNADDTPRYHMGDIIHSNPIQVATSKTDSILFIGTNEGYLHAIQANTGNEIFAYMPQELLKNIKPQYEGISTSDHLYGIDGQITLWHDDTNQNGIKEASESATLFFGLRRGGQAYYALDITTPSTPELLWKITPSKNGFDKLGFTWSIPKIEMLKYQKTITSTLTTKPQPVLIFGGGYIDDHATTNPTGMGTGVYIVDATNGNLLKRYTHSNTGSQSGDTISKTPGKIRALDIDRNGSVDRLYFGDTKGNVWRIDLNANKSAPYNLEDAKILKFAELGGTDANNRSFFVEPDVAIFKHKGKPAISIAMGSGLRPAPLSTDVDDHFFVLLDENVYNLPPSTQPTISLSKLVDAPVINIDLVDNLNKPNSHKGWKLKLNDSTATEPSGEKSLSSALTYQNKILFTTFSAKSSSAIDGQKKTTSCETNIDSSSKLYILDILTGGPSLDLNKDGNTDSKDNWIDIGSGKIPASPQIRFGSYEAKKGGACTNDDCVRKQKIHAADTTVALSPDANLPRVYWIDQEK